MTHLGQWGLWQPWTSPGWGRNLTSVKVVNDLNLTTIRVITDLNFPLQSVVCYWPELALSKSRVPGGVIVESLALFHPAHAQVKGGTYDGWIIIYRTYKC